MKRTLVLLSLLSVCAGLPGLAHAAPTGQLHKRADQGALHASLAHPRARIESASSQRAGMERQASVGATQRAKPTQNAKAKAGQRKVCLAKPVQLLRVRGLEVEPREVSLTTCSGAPNPAALDSVSVLGRPRDVERPLLPEIRAYRALPLASAARQGKRAPKRQQQYRDPAFVTAHVMRLNPGLLVRLQRVAKRYPGRAIEIISGYRPDARETSRHHHGLALDLRVAGIPRERLRDYLRSFEDTGVGYYPNSFFVHMDVRETKAYWVDRSGPGEPADYGPRPTPAKQPGKKGDAVLKGALADLAAWREPVRRNGDKSSLTRASARFDGAGLSGGPDKKAHTTREREPTKEHDEMSHGEVTRAREEARRAVEP